MKMLGTHLRMLNSRSWSHHQIYIFEKPSDNNVEDGFTEEGLVGERGSNIMDQCKEMPRAMNQAGPLLARIRTSDMLRQREPGGSNTTDEYKEKFKKQKHLIFLLP